MSYSIKLTTYNLKLTLLLYHDELIKSLISEIVIKTTKNTKDTKLKTLYILFFLRALRGLCGKI